MLFVVLSFAALVAATIDNSNVLDTIQSAAIALSSGTYTIQNVGTGDFIAFDNANGHEFFPQSGQAQAGSIKFDTTSDATPWSRISVGTTTNNGQPANPRCLSAQWWFATSSDASDDVPGGDWLAVLYACTIGTGSDADSTVRDTKQEFYLIPVDSASNVDLSEGVEAAAGSALAVAGQVEVGSGQTSSASSSEEHDTATLVAAMARIKEAPTTLSSSSSSTATTKATSSKPAALPKEEIIHGRPTAATSSLEATHKATSSSSARTGPADDIHFEKSAIASSFATSAIQSSSAMRMVKCRKSLRQKRDLITVHRAVNPHAKYKHAVGLRSARELKKRSAGVAYYILAVDHDSDMQTRALTGVTATQLGTTTKSTRLKLFDKSTAQQWILKPSF